MMFRGLVKPSWAMTWGYGGRRRGRKGTTLDGVGRSRTAARTVGSGYNNPKTGNITHPFVSLSCLMPLPRPCLQYMPVQEYGSC